MAKVNPVRLELNKLRAARLQASDEMRVLKSQNKNNPVSFATKVKALKNKILLLSLSVNNHKDTYGIIK